MKDIRMTEEDFNSQLLAFFKALADENRLKIVGLLAQREFSVEELAETLSLGVSTTSHHLSRLAKAGLVSARTDGHYYLYSLRTEVLKEMSLKLTHAEALPRLSDDVSTDTYARQVLANFTDAEGRIKAFPEKEKKLLVVLHYVADAFEVGKHYPEKEVNEILLRFNRDTAFIRRSLVEFKLMARQGGGGEYWRV
jgi:predicted transcriptional regulator